MDLKVLGVHVLTRGQDDHVLAPADDVEMTIHLLAQIARAEPAVLGKRLSGRGLVVVIAFEHHRPAYQNLTDTVGVGLVDLYLRAVHRFADRAYAVVVLVCRCRRPARLGQAVALQNGKAELMKVRGHRLVKSRSGGDSDTQLAAEGLMHLAKEFPAEVYAHCPHRSVRREHRAK